MIKRDLYIDKIKPFINKEMVKVITGIRRSGKSVLLKSIIKELKSMGINHENIIFINFESGDYQDITSNTQLNQLIKKLSSNKKGKLYLFFDEIQVVDKWEKSIAGFLVDYDADIYITGSNAKLLSGELATYLSGRYVQIKVYPFNFKEVLKLNKEYYDETDEKKIFNEYIQLGGMPPIFNLIDKNKKVFLEDIYTSIVYKDIIQRRSIRNIELLDRLIRFIMDNIGQTFSANSISKYFKNEKRNVKTETIYNYLSYLEDAFFLNKVRREDLVGKKILKTDEKFFLTDHGFRELSGGNNIKDIGQVLENIVYMEMLSRGYQVFVGKVNNYEVDFVCKKFKEQIYIQVSLTLFDKNTQEREFRPLLEIKDNYPKYVISMDELDFSQDGIIHKNIIDFLKEK